MLSPFNRHHPGMCSSISFSSASFNVCSYIMKVEVGKILPFLFYLLKSCPKVSTPCNSKNSIREQYTIFQFFFQQCKKNLSFGLFMLEGFALTLTSSSHVEKFCNFTNNHYSSKTNSMNKSYNNSFLIEIKEKIQAVLAFLYFSKIFS